MTKWIIISSAAVAIICFIIFVVRPLFSEPGFILPSGSYTVGTHLFELTDYSRIETEVEGGSNRRVAVRAFYPSPAGTESSYNILPSSDPRITAAFAEMYNFPAGGSSESAPSNSMIDAPAAEGLFPIILFSPGSISFNTQNLSNFEELASHGYIVLAVSHTYESIITIFPDDEIVKSSRVYMISESMKISKEEAEAYKANNIILTEDRPDSEKLRAYRDLGNGFFRDVEELLKIRLDDFRFILSSLETLNGSAEFFLHGKMNTESIGMYGHSLGGITASYLCAAADSPLKAGINMDAPIIQYDEEISIKRPFAMFYSTETAIPKAGKINTSGCNDYYTDSSEEEIFSLIFDNTAHYNFSDFNFMPPFFKFTSMLGKINGPRMARLLNAAVLEYFNYSLKGETDNMYGNTESPFREISIRKNR